MNTWLIVILVIIISSLLLEIVVSALNLKALSAHLPSQFKDIYNEEEYARSQKYTRENIRFSLVENSITVCTTLVFLLAGGFNVIDNFARSFGFGTIPTGLVFTGILLLLVLLVHLPFSLYATFVIENRFGFNRTTPRTFVADVIKSILLTVVIGGPIMTLVLWFFEFSGPHAWLYCWIGVFSLTLLLQFLAPVVIMPLFNTFSPLDDGELKESILSYAQRENFRIQGIFVMDGSKRSAKLNAFFTGFGKFKKIVFFDTLLEKLNTDQIIAVLAHEMGHFKHKHLLKMIVASFLQTGIMFYFLSLIMNNSSLFAAFRMDHISIYASLAFFGFLYSPVNLLVSLTFNHFSRKHEYQADQYVVQSTGSAHDLIQGLKILSQANLSNLTPHPLQVVLHYSHPPVLARIDALHKTQNMSAFQSLTA